MFSPYGSPQSKAAPLQSYVKKYDGGMSNFRATGGDYGKNPAVPAAGSGWSNGFGGRGQSVMYGTNPGPAYPGAPSNPMTSGLPQLPGNTGPIYKGPGDHYTGQMLDPNMLRWLLEQMMGGQKQY